jgi:hypothetical protein
MSSEYSENMIVAQANLEEIDSFLSETNRDGLFPRNQLSETNQKAIQLAKLFHSNFEIYRRFNQQDAARELLEKLFDLIESCDEFTSSFKIHLLLSIIDQVIWLDQISENTKQRIKDNLRGAYSASLFEIEMKFWLLTLATEDRQNNPHRSVLEFLRDLADSDEERAGIDLAIAKTAELAAHFCITRGVNLDTAEMWYRQAAIVAKTRLGDHSTANRLLKRASETNRISTHRVYSNPMFAQALQSQPGTKEYAEAMQKIGIAENLTVMMYKNLEANPPSTFLPPLAEIENEYAEAGDKLEKLLNDPRFVLNRPQIEARIAQDKSGGMGFMEWVGIGQFVDLNGNPRGVYGETERIICQYVSEVTNAVAFLICQWKAQGEITPKSIMDLIANTLPDYDTKIFKNGLNSFFNDDYIAATHLLIPQFENMLRDWLRQKGAETKKLNRHNVPSEMLLHDFLNSANVEVQNLLGNELFAILAWFMVNDGPFDYRNKLAHGWLTASECTTPNIPAATIFFTMKVMSLGI